jgi:hypothetical protein
MISPHPCDGAPRRHVLFRWPLVDTKFRTPHLQPSLYRETHPYRGKATPAPPEVMLESHSRSNFPHQKKPCSFRNSFNCFPVRQSQAVGMVLYEGESNENRKHFFKFNLLNESGTQLYHFST